VITATKTSAKQRIFKVRYA